MLIDIVKFEQRLTDVAAACSKSSGDIFAGDLTIAVRE